MRSTKTNADVTLSTLVGGRVDSGAMIRDDPGWIAATNYMSDANFLRC
jgi:hypothetical protein